MSDTILFAEVRAFAAAKCLPKGSISLVKAATARVAGLEAELAEERKQRNALKAEKAAAEEQIVARDAIIAELGKQLQTSRTSSDKAESAMLKQLTAHADAMAAELQSLRRRVADPSALQQAEDSMKAAEARAEAAERDRAHVAEEVSRLKHDVGILQQQLEAEETAKASSRVL